MVLLIQPSSGQLHIEQRSATRSNQSDALSALGYPKHQHTSVFRVQRDSGVRSGDGWSHRKFADRSRLLHCTSTDGSACTTEKEKTRPHASGEDLAGIAGNRADNASDRRDCRILPAACHREFRSCTHLHHRSAGPTLRGAFAPITEIDASSQPTRAGSTLSSSMITCGERLSE